MKTAIITAEQFKEICPTNREPEIWAEEIDRVLFEFGIIEIEDVAMVMAQCAHESGYFTRLVENLNYSTDGLLKTFPRHFRDRDDAASYHRQPERIANRVYQNRMGNGPEASGDGWKYRGRGAIQCTGKTNYAACSKYLFADENILLDDPDILLKKREGLLAAMWFWDANNLKGIRDIVRATRIINGGRNGLAHRKQVYDIAIRVLRVN